MTESEIRTAFAILPPPPETPGERTWVDRVNTPDRLIERGQEVADYFHDVEGRHGREWIEINFRSLAPGLFDLMMRAFPPS